LNLTESQRRWHYQLNVGQGSSFIAEPEAGVINPKTAHRWNCVRYWNGPFGGFTPGGKDWALCEWQFADYLVATNADVPYIDVQFIGKPDTIFNPAGARGAGEIGLTGIPAAIANEVYNATGQRVRDFPITLDKLLVPTHGLEAATADNI
jgi:hypothetical protein